MKKIIYIKPAIGQKCMEPSSLMETSLNKVNNNEAGTGSENDPVNYSNNNGSFWEDEN